MKGEENDRDPNNSEGRGAGLLAFTVAVAMATAGRPSVRQWLTGHSTILFHCKRRLNAMRAHCNALRLPNF